MPCLSSWGLLCTGREGHRFKPQGGQALFHELHRGGGGRMLLHSRGGVPMWKSVPVPRQEWRCSQGASPWIQGTGEGCKATVPWG